MWEGGDGIGGWGWSSGVSAFMRSVRRGVLEVRN